MWAERYLLKQALGSALSAIMERPFTQPGMVPETRTYDDLAEAQALYNSLAPSPRRVPLRRALARLGVRR